MPDSQRSAVITGAGRGIGRALALELARRGSAVAIQSRTERDLFDTRASIALLGGRTCVVVGDATLPEAASDLVSTCEAEFGPIGIAVACAGQALSAPLLRTLPGEMRAMFEVNVMAAFHLVQASARAMIASKTRGRIVVVASTAAVKGARYTTAYATSKHAVLGLVRCAALELAEKGITVNAICPGWVQTPMLDAAAKNVAQKTGCSTEAALHQFEAMIPMRSVLHVEDVAGLLRYLASPEASHVTGQALVIDGGETIQ